MAYVLRTLERFARAASRQMPVLMVTGGRQVGKTTFLRHLAMRQRTYVTLDDPLALGLAREDAALFLQRYKAPVLIDEIQYAPGLLPHIKMAVDLDRRPGAYWLTGSQPFHLMHEVSESLAGRVAVLQLLGLSRQEQLGLGAKSKPFLPGARRRKPAEPLHLADLYDVILRGAYPALSLNSAMNRDLFYSSYVQTYLQRDVRDLARVGDEAAFMRFLRAAAARTAQQLNLSDLARDADVAPNTAKHWISILQTSGIIWLLEAWHSNLGKRLVKSPKLYFLDTGLCAWLTRWSTSQTLESGAMAGAIFENWVIVELLKSWWHNGLPAPFYHYRDTEKREIDLLIEHDGKLWPVEIKKTASPNLHDIRTFTVLRNTGAPVGHGTLICMIAEPLPLDRDNEAVPAAWL